jgi:hypothetical protein
MTADVRAVAIREWNAACTHADDRMAREIAAARERRDETVTRATDEVNNFLAGSEDGVRITAAVKSRPDHAAWWQALKDDLAERIAGDEAVRQGMVDDGEDALAAPFGGLVSANRSTLRKMRELEAGK